MKLIISRSTHKFASLAGLLLILASLQLQAQAPITGASNFSVTNNDGDRRHAGLFLNITISNPFMYEKLPAYLLYFT